jgi:hypothetical protein
LSGEDAVIAIVDAKRAELKRLCKQFYVRRLEIFGSASAGAHDPVASDLDFLVEFGGVPSGRHADCYFGLLDALQSLFGRAVDLVETVAIRNPYFLESIEPTRQVLYAA